MKGRLEKDKGWPIEDFAICLLVFGKERSRLASPLENNAGGGISVPACRQED